MKIIDRYVLWTFLKNYLISFMVLVGMYVVLDMVFNFDELADVKGATDVGGVTGVFGTIYNIGDYYFYQCFLFFVHLSGIIPVVAAAFTLMRLSRFNELTAILASGVPLLRVAMPIILAGVVLNGLMIADQELLIPEMLPKLTRRHDDMHRTDVKTFPIQAMQASDNALVYAARYTPPSGDKSAAMDEVDVIERREEERPALDAKGRPIVRKVLAPVGHLTARRAVWNPATRLWDLEEGQRVLNLGESDEPAQVAVVDSYQSNITPEEIALYRSGDWVEMLSTARIDDLIARPGSYGQANLLRVKHWRFTQPIMNVILLLLAIPCVLTREPGRLKSAATKCLILTGLGMGSVFLSHQLAGQPSSNPDWARIWPALMAWFPIFVWGPIAVILLDRVKT